jgi:hypothetical protein
MNCNETLSLNTSSHFENGMRFSSSTSQSNTPVSSRHCAIKESLGGHNRVRTNKYNKYRARDKNAVSLADTKTSSSSVFKCTDRHVTMPATPKVIQVTPKSDEIT